MASIAYTSTHARFGIMVFVASMVMAMGILKFGPGPITALCILPWFIVLFHRHPLLPALLWVVLLFPSTAFRYDAFTLGGFALLPMDPAYFFAVVFLVVNTMLRRREMIRVLKENPFLSLFMLLVGVYILLYTPLYGKSALGEARKFYFHFLFPLLAAVSIKEPRNLRNLLLIVLLVASCISIVGILRLIGGIPIDNLVNARACLILMLGTFSIIIYNINGFIIINRIADSLMIMLFISVVIMTQHRSVWLAGAFGLLLLFGLYRKRILFLSRAVTAAILFLGMMSLGFLSMPEFEHSLMRSLGGILSPSSDANASWRMMGWQQQLDRVLAKNPLFGEGLGGYYSWNTRGSVVKAAPHNGYVQIVLKFGLFGLVVYACLAFRFFRKTLDARQKAPPGPMKAYVEMGILNFGAAHAYLMGYGFPLIMLIFYALGMSAARLLQDCREVPRTV